MPTLTDLIKESLEGKLSDQIRASLEADCDEMNEATQDILKILGNFTSKWSVSGKDSYTTIKDKNTAKTLNTIEKRLKNFCDPIDNISSTSCIVFRHNDSKNIVVEIYYEPATILYQLVDHGDSVFVNVEDNQPTGYNIIAAYGLPEDVVREIFKSNGVRL